MSHEITAIDSQEGRTVAWHKLTKVNPLLSLENQTALQWEALSRPLYRQIGNEFVKTETCELYASDNPQITIGKPFDCETYGVISNKAFLEIVREALVSIRGAHVESLGSVCGRGRTFVSLKLKELENFSAAGRTFVPYLNFLNSFDASAPFAVNSSNICTVCNNTFSANLRATDKVKSGLAAARMNSRDGEVKVRLKHTKNVLTRLENIPEIVDGFLGAQMQFRAALNALDSEMLAAPVARNFFAGLLSKGEKRDEISTRQVNQVERLSALFVSGRGNAGQTRADAFQAVTEYATHEISGENADRSKQFVSSEFGAGAALKVRALSALGDGEEFSNLVSVGEFNLATASN